MNHIATQTSPTRSQNSSPNLLSDCDRVSNSSSSFTYKTSSSSSSDRCDDLKSTSSLSFEILSRSDPNYSIDNPSPKDQWIPNDNIPNIWKTRHCCDLSNKNCDNFDKSNFYNCNVAENCEENCDTFDSRLSESPKTLNALNKNYTKKIQHRKYKRLQHHDETKSLSRSLEDPCETHNKKSQTIYQNGCLSESPKLDASNDVIDSNGSAPVWILRSDVRRHRSAEDRRGVVFDSLNGIDDFSDQLDQPLNSTSSSSLPLTHASNIRKSHSNINHHSTSNMFITDLGNKSSSAPVLKKVNESQELLSSHIKVCIIFTLLVFISAMLIL